MEGREKKQRKRRQGEKKRKQNTLCILRVSIVHENFISAMLYYILGQNKKLFLTLNQSKKL